jgi:SAM-dependent methyltransferase
MSCARAWTTSCSAPICCRRTSSRNLPENVILYNFEQVSAESAWMKKDYLDALASHRCWDYSRRNIDALKTLKPGADPRYVPVGYADCLRRIEPAAVQDIDVLFYGSVNERRRRILDALKESGLRVVELFGAYGKERDAAIARAKVVLNMHFYDSRILEAVRLSYLMSNAKAVVSECAEDTEVYPHYRDGLALVSSDNLVEACRALVADESARRQLEQCALKAVQEVRYRDILQAGDLFDPSPGAARARRAARPARRRPRLTAPTSLPRTLNLGSGKDWRADCLNADILPRVHPDWVLDVCQPPPFGTVVKTERFGEFSLQRGMFDAIVANDVLEHLPDLVGAMTCCLELLSVGGRMHVHVPYDLSLGAWQDPTHVRAFNENSWLYYTDWHWYLGWKTARFVVKDLDCLFSALGKDLKQKGVPDDEILRTPRAIDSMKVILEKIALPG